MIKVELVFNGITMESGTFKPGELEQLMAWILSKQFEWEQHSPLCEPLFRFIF